MPRIVTAAAGVVASVAVAALLLAGCAAGATTASSPSPDPTPTPKVVVPEDAEAFAILEAVAPKALKLDGGTVSYTECWTPSEHMFQNTQIAPAGTWKVLCRVHYELKGVARYQDANCIGDFDLHPMLDHCFVWKYHSDLPVFEDGDRLASAPPTPLP